MSNELNRAAIIAMAKAAGMNVMLPAERDLSQVWHGPCTEELERFAALARATLPAQASSAPDERKTHCGDTELEWHKKSLAAHAGKLTAVWKGITDAMLVELGHVSSSEPFDDLHVVLRELAAYRASSAPAVATGGAVEPACEHSNTSRIYTGGGYPVDYCPDCGLNQGVGADYTHPAPIAEEATGGAKQAATCQDCYGSGIDEAGNPCACECEHTQHHRDAIKQTATVPDGWQPITAPGQVKVGTKLRFNIGSEKFRETAKLILHAGTDQEEIIYNKSRNFYLITSMAMANKGSQKNVEFLRAAATTDGEGE